MVSQERIIIFLGNYLTPIGVEIVISFGHLAQCTRNGSKMKCQIHKYRRIRSSKNKHDVYKCVSCPHYVIGDLVIGREAICWYCGNVFQMSKLSLLLKPHCGCKTSITFSKSDSRGAGMDDLKVKILEKRGSETPTSDNPIKSALLDHLLSKLPK